MDFKITKSMWAKFFTLVVFVMFIFCLYDMYKVTNCNIFLILMGVFIPLGVIRMHQLTKEEETPQLNSVLILDYVNGKIYIIKSFNGGDLEDPEQLENVHDRIEVILEKNGISKDECYWAITPKKYFELNKITYLEE